MEMPTPSEAMALAQEMIDDMPDSDEKRMLQREHNALIEKRNEAIRQLKEGTWNEQN